MALNKADLKIEKVKCEAAIKACRQGIDLNTMMLGAINEELKKYPEEKKEKKKSPTGVD